MDEQKEGRHIKTSTMRRTLIKKRTLAELFLSDVLRKKWFWRVIEQQPIGPYFADFWFPDFGLVIELDGGVHEGREQYDSKRDRWITYRHEKYGFVRFDVVRFYNEMVLKYPHEILTAIENALLQRVEIIKIHGKRKKTVKTKDQFGRIRWVEKMVRGQDLRNMEKAVKIWKDKEHFLNPFHTDQNPEAECTICNDLSMKMSYERSQLN